MYLVLIGFASRSTLFTFYIVRFCKIYTTGDSRHSKTAAGKMFDIIFFYQPIKTKTHYLTKYIRNQIFAALALGPAPEVYSRFVTLSVKCRKTLFYRVHKFHFALVKPCQTYQNSSIFQIALSKEQMYCIVLTVTCIRIWKNSRNKY